MAVKENTQFALRQAIQRLLEGKSIKTDGELTWNNVCTEAEVARSTAARAADVIAEWKAALAARKEENLIVAFPDDPHTLPSDVLRKSVINLSPRQIHEGLRKTIRIMGNHIQALTLALRQKDITIEQYKKELEDHVNVVIMTTPKSPRF